MKGPFQSAGKLVWKEFLSADEIRMWCTADKKPLRLQSQFAVPGVYRFVFPEFQDEHGQHVPCYVGQSKNLATRIPFYFRPASQEERRDKNSEVILPDGWHVRGQVQNSSGDFALQVLSVEGAISLGGITLNQHDLVNSFARVLLENWAILSSARIDHMVPTNREFSESVLDLFKIKTGSEG